MSRAVAVVSGGLDSTTLAYRLAAEGHELSLLSFDYGQRHVRELEFAAQTAGRLGAAWRRVDLSAITDLIAASALTGDTPVPEGHYAESSMKATVVPNRNMIMLSIAAGHAVSIGAEVVATGVHAGDHFVYPDCRPLFVDTMNTALAAANEGFTVDGFHLQAPFLHWSKTDIAAHAVALGVPLDETWSCYQGGDVHCGRCGTCCERREAIEGAGGDDPTQYEDRDFWLVAASEFQAGTRR